MATFLEALYGGIRPHEVPGHGGPECAAYLSKETKITETCITTVIMLVVLSYALKRVSLPSQPPPEDYHFWKGPLLALLSIVYGLQIGYKISSGQLLYMLNPCHVITVAEVGHSAISCTKCLLLLLTAWRLGYITKTIYFQVWIITLLF